MLGHIGLSADEMAKIFDKSPTFETRKLIGVADPRDEDLVDRCFYLRYRADLKNLGSKPFGLCLLEESQTDSSDLYRNDVDRVRENGLVLTVADAKLAFIKIANLFYRERVLDSEMVHADAKLAKDSFNHPTNVIGAGVKIGARAYLGPGVIVGPGVTIGDDAYIHGQCSIFHADIGTNCQVGAGVRIGQAGFGVHAGPEGPLPVPQLGRVLIGDRVCIGANTTIDRGTLRDTIIGDDCHIDNQVQIAHNVTLGVRCIIAALTGISGSCVIGDDVVMGGQVGFADHLSVGNGARLAARAGIMHNIPAGETWGGLPAKPIRQFMREVATLSQLTRKKK